jgi:hypothetical protein
MPTPSSTTAWAAGSTRAETVNFFLPITAIEQGRAQRTRFGYDSASEQGWHVGNANPI